MWMLAQLAFYALEGCGQTALKQRPVEAERECKIATVDHRIRLLGRSCHTADRHPAVEDAGFGTRDQCLHFGIIDLAAFVDGGGEIAGPITATSMPGVAMISSMRLTASTCSIVIMQIMSSSAAAM